MREEFVFDASEITSISLVCPECQRESIVIQGKSINFDPPQQGRCEPCNNLRSQQAAQHVKECLAVLSAVRQREKSLPVFRFRIAKKDDAQVKSGQLAAPSEV